MPTPPPPNVGAALVHVFLDAGARHRALHESWIKASYQLGGRLPASLLSTSIEREGQVDLVLRSIEDEIAAGRANLDNPVLSPAHYLMMMSSYWISGIYESLRLLRDRKRLEDTDRVKALFRAVELVRMTIDKHEIASDQKLKEPLQMVRQPAKGDATDAYVYDRSDSARAHIMPTGFSTRGSVMWQPVDLKSNSGPWVERRWVSEEVIDLWGGDAAPGPTES